MNRRLLLLLSALASLIWVSVAQADKIELATIEYPPYYGKNLENQGFITEIIVTAFERSGHEVTTKFMPWKRAFEGTKAGKHTGVYTMWYRADREEWFAFSDPLPANEVGFMKRTDAAIEFESLQGLKPYKIGVVRGYSNPKGFDEAALTTEEVAEDKLNISKLLRKRVDLVLIDEITGQHIINTQHADRKDELEWLTSVQVDPQHVAFSKKHPNYEAQLTAFNSGLKAITEDGTLKKIMESHGF